MKILKKTTAAVLAVFAAITAVTSIVPAAQLNAGATDIFTIDAKAAVLMDSESGDTFYSLDAHTPYPTASTSKLLVALLAIEAVERGDVQLSDRVVASENYRFDIGKKDSPVEISVGEAMTLEDLLNFALIKSSNESSNVIAEYISGDVETFIALMNTRAAELGCENFHFANTHGLPNAEHYASAYDLALIAGEVMRHPVLMRICSTTAYTISETNMSKERSFNTTNYLLRKTSPMYYYAEATGLKTGSTGEAGHCLVAAADKDGIQVVSVVLGAKDIEIEPGVFQVESFTETKRMFEWFFDNFEYKDVIKTTELVATLPVSLGKDADTVVVRPVQGIRKILPKDMDMETEIEREITFVSGNAKTPVEAPVERSQVLGTITLRNGKTEYGTIALVANTSVGLDHGAYMMNKVKVGLSTPAAKMIFASMFLLAVLIVFAVLKYKSNVRKRKRAKVAKKAERVVYRDDD